MYAVKMNDNRIRIYGKDDLKVLVNNLIDMDCRNFEVTLLSDDKDKEGESNDD